MKTIGLIGGMSWESSAEYYRLLNELVRERLGGLHSAPCILHSLDFAEIEELQVAGDWERAGEILADAARGLQAAGADLLLICTNTMHKVAGQVEAAGVTVRRFGPVVASPERLKLGSTVNGAHWRAAAFGKGMRLQF